MKPSQPMQHIIEALASKHGVYPHAVDTELKLTLPGYLPLVIRNAGLHQVSVYHFFLAQGDVVPDPQIIFWVTPQGWYPIAVTQTIGGHRAYARLNEEGTAVLWVAQKAQADLAHFAELWANNLKDQGWLARGEPVPKALFPLGEIFLTPGARAIFATTGMDPARMLHRHVTGDWAEMSEHDRSLNQRAVQDGEARIFSAYTLVPGVTIWVITEADLSSTTLLLPEGAP